MNFTARMDADLGGFLFTAEAWQVFRRAVAAVMLVNFLSVTPQLPAILGDFGVEPTRKLLQAARRDAGSLWVAVARFPTLLWFSSSNIALWVIGLTGSLASTTLVLASLSRLQSAALFLVVWICWVSFVNGNPALFWFPWDRLACESALYGALLPTHGPPEYAVSFLFRWLLFRVMFGMALAKFRKLDDRSRELTYIYHFLEWQPFPTAAAAVLRDLMPMSLHKLSFFIFGIIELALPLLLWVGTKSADTICFIGFVGLQIMIQWTGNFGCFNILTAALCIPLLASVPRVAAPQRFVALPSNSHAELILTGTVLLHTLVTLPYLLHTTSWTHLIWLHRPSKLPWWMPSIAAAALRAAEPLRIWNSYGVFIARGNVPHQVPVLQMKRTSKSPWEDIEPKYLVCAIDEPPRRFAPHHPRIDHYLFYSNFKPEDMKLSCLEGTNPYYLGPYCLTEKIITRLLKGDSTAWSFFRRPTWAPEGARIQPACIRHSAWHYHMLTSEQRHERRVKGLPYHFWRRELLGTGPPISRDDRSFDDSSTPLPGIRGEWDTFIFDKFHMNDDDALCIDGVRLNSKEVAVLIPQHAKPPASRSVVNALSGFSTKANIPGRISTSSNKSKQL